MYLMDHIDDFISAEIPDPNDPKSKILNDIVVKNMIDCPCGHYNCNCVCMLHGYCSKEFSKPLSYQTINLSHLVTQMLTGILDI